ncbi:MAG: restriction endonuclease subunit S [Lamprobacter sp.]|uniref:restriction endonuclease subunit S n=1 Tax=Lamprobacter sp. TaxID=3100796 RepID=UPI002B25AE39|nr:restriction endonuclease subunit S [Lamprobacter sp.]MEA3640660.1 restriction endonuclease subunit S [Lamprobacter sp.]
MKRGYDLPKKSRVEGSFPLFSANGVTDYIDQYMVSGPGVVTGRSGTIGKVHFIETDYWPLNTALYVEDFHGNDERFIHYFLTVFDLTRFASGAAVPTLNRNSLSAEEVCVPDTVDDQRRIVTHLDALTEHTNTLESETQERLDQLTALKSSLLDAAFRGQL